MKIEKSKYVIQNLAQNDSYEHWENSIGEKYVSVDGNWILNDERNYVSTSSLIEKSSKLNNLICLPSPRTSITAKCFNPEMFHHEIGSK